MTRARLPLAMLLSLVLSACVGGGGGGGQGNSSANQESGAVFYDAFFDGTSLKVVDRRAAAPSAQAVHKMSDVGKTPWHWQFWSGKISDTRFTDKSSQELLFVDAGRFYRLSLYSVGLPVPKQVSSESQAGLICDAGKQRQTIHTEDAGIVYRLPGSDGVCGTADDVYRRLVLSMGATEAPRTISQEEFESLDIFDSQDNVTGTLSVSNGNVVWRDRNFSNPEILLSGQSAYKLAYAGESPDFRYFVLAVQVGAADGGSEWRLHVFDQQTRTLSAELGNSRSGSSIDGSFGFRFIGIYRGDVYLTQNHTDIIKLPLDGSTASSLVLNQARGMAIAADQLIFSDLSNSNNGSSALNIYRMSLNGGTSVPILLKPGVARLHVVQDRLFYTQISFSAGVVGANSGSVRLDGTDDRSIPNALLIGYALSDVEDLASSRRHASTTVFINKDMIIGDSGEYGGGSLLTMNLQSGEPAYAPMPVPAGIVKYWVTSADKNQIVLASATVQGSSASQLFVVNYAKGTQVSVGTATGGNGWWTDWVSGR